VAGGEGLRLQSAYRERLADYHTPVSVLRALVAPGQAGALLESVEGGERWGRFSLVLADPILTLRLRRDGLTLGWPDGRCDRREGAPLACLEAALPSPLPGATAAIEAAVVGVLGWDLARTFEPIGEGPPPLHPDLPLGAFFLPGVSVAFDNLRHVVRLGVHRLLAPGKCPAGEGWATEGLDALEARLAAGRVPAPLLPLASAGVAKPGAAGFASRTDPRALAEAIAEARERILAGECIQVVLARTF
jgi:anthranilate synthase component 1